jgi:hypothetical protein
MMKLRKLKASLAGIALAGMVSAAAAQPYKYSSYWQPNLAQIGVTSSLHADLVMLGVES